MNSLLHGPQALLLCRALPLLYILNTILQDCDHYYCHDGHTGEVNATELILINCSRFNLDHLHDAAEAVAVMTTAHIDWREIVYGETLSP